MKLIELAVWLVLSAGSFAALRLTPERVTQDLMQVLNPPQTLYAQVTELRRKPEKTLSFPYLGALSGCACLGRGREAVSAHGMVFCRPVPVRDSGGGFTGKPVFDTVPLRRTRIVPVPFGAAVYPDCRPPHGAGTGDNSVGHHVHLSANR